MGNYRVITGQNIYDVALHLYGSIEGIVDLLINNPGLSLETELRTRQEFTYTDGFIINADVVAYNEMHGIVPSNGERHVYPKHFTCPQTAVFSLSAALVSVQCEVSGTGTLEIDWGDDSAAETVILGHIHATPYVRQPCAPQAQNPMVCRCLVPPYRLERHDPFVRHPSP